MQRFTFLIFMLTVCIGISAQRPIEIIGAWSYGSKVGDYPTVRAPFHRGPDAQTHFANLDGNDNALTLGININVYKNLSVGASWTGLNTYSVDFGYKGDGFKKMGTMKQSCNVIMLNGKYEWLKAMNFRFYSRLGAGIALFSKPDISADEFYFEYEDRFEWPDGKKSSVKVAWQATFLGIGYRPLPFVELFAEGGLGYNGALMSGIKVIL